MAEGIIEVNDDSFDGEVLKSDLPVLVDFWAVWCGPCRAIGPMIESLFAEYGDKLKFTKLNVDDNPITPSQYSIKAIPTLIFFKEGSVVEQITGAVARVKLEESIKSLV